MVAAGTCGVDTVSVTAVFVLVVTVPVSCSRTVNARWPQTVVESDRAVGAASYSDPSVLPFDRSEIATVAFPV